MYCLEIIKKMNNEVVAKAKQKQTQEQHRQAERDLFNIAKTNSIMAIV